MLVTPGGTNEVRAAPQPDAGTPAGADALWQVRSRVSRDVDEHAAGLSGWHQQYDQLGGGSFTGRLDEALSDGVQLFRERTSHPLRQRCEVWKDALWCGITTADDGSRLDGRRVGAAGIMASGSDGCFDLVSPAGHDIVGFVVSRAALAQHAPELALPRAGAAAWWPADPTQREAALVHARAILVLAAAGVARDLRSAVLDVVAGLLAARGPGRRERGNASARRRLVAQVHAWIEATPDRAPSVGDLCATLHVSRRTLQYAFEDEVGVNPLAYLRSVRLNGVRRLLRDASNGFTVQRAAAHWGFWNLSAFAADYRRQFGERASDTLAHTRGRTAARSL